jgi:hypothetical protein
MAILLLEHTYISGRIYDPSVGGSFMVSEIASLEEMGLIQFNLFIKDFGTNIVSTDITEKGRAYARAMLAIPLPVQTWTFPT